MNLPRLFPSVIVIACLAAGVTVFIKSRELASLQHEQQQLEAQRETNAVSQNNSSTSADAPATAAPSSPAPELLQLRNQVGQLTARSHELSAVTAENERLRTQVADRSRRNTNSVIPPLPPDYIRANKAQWRGLSTPEAVMESFVWAVRNHDMTNIMQIVTPEIAQLMQADVERTEKKFANDSDIPGVRIARQESMPDGSLKLYLEFIPGAPEGAAVYLRRYGAEWRLELH